jgi:hypothetical protein
MTEETLRVRADIACVTYTGVCTFTTARKWYRLFLDQSDFKVMLLNRKIQKANKRIGNVSCRIQL